jgi:hypothetical protein
MNTYIHDHEIICVEGTLNMLLPAHPLSKIFWSTFQNYLFLVLLKEILIIVTRGVSHRGLAIYIKKYPKAKEELWKVKYFNMKKYNLQKLL